MRRHRCTATYAAIRAWSATTPRGGWRAGPARGRRGAEQISRPPLRLSPRATRSGGSSGAQVTHMYERLSYIMRYEPQTDRIYESGPGPAKDLSRSMYQSRHPPPPVRPPGLDPVRHVFEIYDLQCSSSSNSRRRTDQARIIQSSSRQRARDVICMRTLAGHFVHVHVHA